MESGHGQHLAEPGQEGLQQVDGCRNFVIKRTYQRRFEFGFGAHVVGCGAGRLSTGLK